MGLPSLKLTNNGGSRWREIVLASGYRLQFDEKEIERCKELGSSCEITGHPSLVSEYPLLISQPDSETTLRCLEITMKSDRRIPSDGLGVQEDQVVLVFMPRNQEENQLLDQVRSTLVKSNAVLE